MIKPYIVCRNNAGRRGRQKKGGPPKKELRMNPEEKEKRFVKSIEYSLKLTY